MSANSTQLHHWFRAIIFVFLSLVVFLAAAGFVYQNISEVRDHRFHPMPGQLIDIGGYKLHLYCQGQGSPTVILDSGLGDPYGVWRKVQPQVSQFVRVCAFDRAGIGYSDSGPRAVTSKDIAEELHTLLHKAGIPAPVVLVGHSAGGYDVRIYASLYPDEVAGMVLVDASHPEQERRFPAALKNLEASADHEAKLEEFTMPFGLPRLFKVFDPFDYCSSDANLRAAQCNFHSVHTGIAMTKAFRESAAQAAATGSLGDMPLAVLSHDPDKPQPGLPSDLDRGINEAWEKMQEELAHLSTRGSQMIARNSLHYIQIDRPELVVEAIRNTVDQVRTARSASQP